MTTVVNREMMTMLLTCGFMVDGLGRARACACAEMKMGKKSPVVTYICLSKMRFDVGRSGKPK